MQRYSSTQMQLSHDLITLCLIWQWRPVVIL